MLDYGISFGEDIIKEMSQELGIPEKEIQEIVDLNIKYIKETVVETDHVLIGLPNLCTLRYNWRLGMSAEHAYRRNNRSEKYVPMVERRNLLLKDHYKAEYTQVKNYNKPLFVRLYKKLKRLIYLKSSYKNMYKYWSQLQHYTNSIVASDYGKNS